MDHSAYLPAIEHKTWARAVKRGGFYPGNASTYAQTSGFIRAFTETECNGRTWQPGELQEFDLKQLAARSMPDYLKPIVRSHLKTNGGVLYCIRHYNGEQRVVHGWILMDYHQNELLWRTWPTSRKSESCIQYALKKIQLDAIRYNAVRACHRWDDTLARIAESTPGGLVGVIQMAEAAA